nr:hypothetical protein [Tanacetum cinerariifolium]
MRDGHRDNQALQVYMKDDTSMCEPHEASYVQGYHGGYYDRNSRNLYPNHNINHNYHRYQPRNIMPHPSRYFKLPKTLTGEMMREWMAMKTKANKRMKNQPPKSLPHTTSTKPRHEFVYKPPFVRNKNDKGDVKDIEEDVIKPIPTIPNPNLINSNSLTVPPFHEDCTVHIPYTNAKTFADDVLSNHVGDKELKSTGGVKMES